MFNFRGAGPANLSSRIAVIAMLVSACASTPETVNQKMDPLTGVIVTYSNMPLIMFREDPSQAAFARNYVHVGPIQINRSGNYHHYLWLGAWNNMQSIDSSEEYAGFETIVVFADGQPLSLELVGSTPSVIGASEPVYLKPVATSTEAYYRVTADQIRLMSEATDFRLQTTGIGAREFLLWDTQSLQRSLQNFLQEINF